jgi:membrane protein YdbS with pleckstrin-like domain
MSKKAEDSTSPLWTGRPWILPGVLARTVLILAVAILVFWAEITFNIAFSAILGLQIILWTALLFFLAWLVSLVHLLLLRASNHYVLKKDSLEIKNGILGTKSFVIVPSGFADLEVDRSLSGRILNMGNIIVRSQSETDSVMVRVRDPLTVAERVREVLSRPIVRIEPDESTTK